MISACFRIIYTKGIHDLCSFRLLVTASKQYNMGMCVAQKIMLDIQIQTDAFRSAITLILNLILGFLFSENPPPFSLALQRKKPPENCRQIFKVRKAGDV